MISNKQCRNCKYRGYLRNGTVICQYIIAEKQRRGCNEGKCNKHEKGDAYEEHDF